MSSILVTGSFSRAGSGIGSDVVFLSESGERIDKSQDEVGKLGLSGRVSSVLSGTGGTGATTIFSGDGEAGMGRAGVGTEGTESSTCGQAGDRTGLEGAVLPGADGTPSLLGMTVKELRDWRRRLARARAWTSLAGNADRSGRGEGRISNLGELRGSVGLAKDSARAQWLSGEHGTLALDTPSALSQSRSLTSLEWFLSVSSLGLTVTLRDTPPTTSK